MIDERERVKTGETPLGPAVETALARMKAVWRAQAWEPALLREYRRVLAKAHDADEVERVVDRAIDDTDGRFPPPPGAFARMIDAAARKRALSTKPVRHDDADVDRAALRDAYAALDLERDDDYRREIEGQVETIKARLRRRGVDTSGRAEDPSRVRFRRAAQRADDPAGTVRLRRILPERALRAVPDPDDEPFPLGPKNGGGR